MSASNQAMVTEEFRLPRPAETGIADALRAAGSCRVSDALARYKPKRNRRTETGDLIDREAGVRQATDDVGGRAAKKSSGNAVPSSRR